MLYFKFKERDTKNYPHEEVGGESTPLVGKIIIGILIPICWLFSKIFPSSNPDYDDKLEDVEQWYIEYDDSNYDEVLREIGLNANNEVIVKMPDDRNYGFWLDTDMKLEDFKESFYIEMITETEFNDLWNSVTYDRKKKKCVPVGIC